MKVVMVFCLVVSVSFGLPQNDIRDQYYWKDNEKLASSNSIEHNNNNNYDNRRPSLNPTLPIALYKGLMQMNAKQVGSIGSLVRPLIKPILTSIELQILTEFADESLRLFREDPNIKALVREGVDSLQAIYETSDGKLPQKVITSVVSLYSDEETARSFSSLMSDMSPTLESWVLEPMEKYYRSYLAGTVDTLRRTFQSFFGNDLASNEIARSGRWSDVVEMYIERLSEMASEAKDIMRETITFIEMQEAQNE